MRAPLALLLAAGGLSLAACATAGGDPLYADGSYAGAPYLDPTSCWTYGWASTFDYPYCGWYNGFFYPGSGGYVYDGDHHRRAWTPDEQIHWAGRDPTLGNGMHSPGPARIPDGLGGREGGDGAHGFGPGPARIGGGFGNGGGARMPRGHSGR